MKITFLSPERRRGQIDARQDRFRFTYVAQLDLHLRGGSLDCRGMLAGSFV